MFSNHLFVGFRLVALPLLMHTAFAQVYVQDGTASQIPEPVGEYFLARVNSQELPAVVSENGAGRQEVIEGSVMLEADATFTWRTLYRYSEGGSVDERESSGRGTYLQQGTRIIFMVDVGDDRLEGILQGNTLTIQADVPMTYRKIFEQVHDQVAPGGTGESRRSTPAFTVSDPGGGELPPPPRAPPPNRITFTLSLAPDYLPASWQELCHSSTLIVEADVESILPARQNLRYPPGVQLLQDRRFPIFRYLETDAILRVARVLKGSEPARQVLISQKGGAVGPYIELPSQYNLMQRGERYILFLEDETQPDLPRVAGIPHYALNGAWTGMFRINETGVDLSSDTADTIREQFEGGSPQDLINAIQRCSQTQP